MIQDNYLKFSDAQAITVDAAGTNRVDFVNSAPDVGTGENLYCVVQNVTALADTTDSDAQVVVSLASNATSAATEGAMANKVTVGTFACATSALAAGQVSIIKLPPGFPVARYVGIHYDVTTTGAFTGSFDAQIVKDVQKWEPKAQATCAVIDKT